MGPFREIQYPNFVQSPIRLGPKDGGSKTRLIFNLSHDFPREGLKNARNSINFFTPKELCSVKYNNMDHVIQTLLELRKQFLEGRWNEILVEYGDLESDLDVMEASNTVLL